VGIAANAIYAVAQATSEWSQGFALDTASLFPFLRLHPSFRSPGDACGPCFNAITQGAVALVGAGVNATQAVAQAQGIPTAAAGFAIGVQALQQAQDCIQLLKLRVLQQNPIIYKAFALQDLASDLGCRPLVGCPQLDSQR
jgi:hypothetical protein